MQKRGSLMLLMVIMVIVVFLLGGCVQADYHVTINRDGSGELDYKIGMNAGMVGLISSDKQNPIDQMRQQAIDGGFQVTNFNGNGMLGITAKKHVNSLQSLPVVNGFGAQGKQNMPTIRVAKGLFQDKYTVDGNVDLTAMKPKQNDQYAELSNAMLSQVKLNFILTLPVKPKTSNSSMEKDEGRTLVWQLIPGSQNKIHLEATVLNTKNIILTGIGAGVLLIILIAGVIIRRRKQPTEDI